MSDPNNRGGGGEAPMQSKTHRIPEVLYKRKHGKSECFIFAES
jgi:hypothetical protein